MRRCPELRTRLCVGAAPEGWLSFEERCAAAGDGETPGRPDQSRRPAAPVLHQRHRRPTRRWCSTLIPTRSVTSEPPASGTTCDPAICTGRSPTPAGRRRRGAGCSARCTSVPRSSTSPSAAPIRTRSSASSHAIASRRSARRRRSTGGWSRPTSPRTTSRRSATARAPASRSTPRSSGRGREGTRRAHDLRRLRPDRDDVPRRQLPHDGDPARIDGTSRARLRRRHRRRRRRADRARARSATSSCAAIADHPIGLFPGYYDDPDGDRRRVPRPVLLHRRQGRAWTRTATSGSRGATTT